MLPALQGACQAGTGAFVLGRAGEEPGEELRGATYAQRSGGGGVSRDAGSAGGASADALAENRPGGRECVFERAKCLLTPWEGAEKEGREMRWKVLKVKQAYIAEYPNGTLRDRWLVVEFERFNGGPGLQREYAFALDRAHNLFLDRWAAFGLIDAVLWLLLYLHPIWRLLSRPSGWRYTTGLAWTCLPSLYTT